MIQLIIERENESIFLFQSEKFGEISEWYNNNRTWKLEDIGYMRLKYL